MKPRPQQRTTLNQIDLTHLAQIICDERGLKFVRRVGEGSFKETFEVLSKEGLQLALKLRKATIVSKRDLRETEAMLRCNHKNIARLVSVDLTEYNGQNVLVTLEEFLPGGTLTSKGTLAPPECLQIGSQLIDALAHLASLGLVHRDIKPDNMMFRGDHATPVITDFGIVRDLGDSSITPTWAALGPGTPFFSSPEQLNNQKDMIDWRSDQFSLGITLAFMTFASHPYALTGDSDQRTVERVAAREGPDKRFPVTAEAGGLAVLTRMVAPWPVDRFRGPHLLADAWQGQMGQKV